MKRALFAGLAVLCASWTAVAAAPAAPGKAVLLRERPIGGPAEAPRGEGGDGEIVLVSGQDVVVDVPPGFVRLLPEQYVFDVPEGAESLIVELSADDPAEDIDVALSYGVPVEVDDWGAYGDAVSESPLGKEEASLWGVWLQAGRYYVGIDSWSDKGSRCTLRLTLDGAFVALDSGIETEIFIPEEKSEPGDFYILDDAHQYRFRVPEGAQSVYVRLQCDEISDGTFLGARYVEPCGYSEDGFYLADKDFAFVGGFQEACLTGPDVLPGEDLYLWISNDAGMTGWLTGKLLVVADGCFSPLAPGDTIGDVARATRRPREVLLGAKQFVLSLRDPLSELELSLASTGWPENLDLYVRKGAPVESDGEKLLADFQAAAASLDPEVLRIRCSDLTPGDYYVAVSNPNQAPIAYMLAASAGLPCPGGGAKFKRGDLDGSAQLNLTDAMALLSRLFLGGAPPSCDDAADANDDGKLSITDAITILGHLFLGAGPLAPPFEACGTDGTNDKLGCASFKACP